MHYISLIVSVLVQAQQRKMDVLDKAWLGNRPVKMQICGRALPQRFSSRKHGSFDITGDVINKGCA